MAEPAKAVDPPSDPDRRDPVRQELRRDGRRVLTVAQAATFTPGWSEDYIRHLIHKGALPARQPTARRTLITEADLYLLLYGRST